MSIAEKAMVLNLNIGMWAGYRLDREATRKVTADANADGDAARVNKHLVPKETTRRITSAAAAIRNHFYENTLPWKDNGDRLLTRVMYLGFIEEHGRLVERFYDAVETFLTRDYPSAVDQAGFRMGTMFNINDYPSPTSLRNKFYINLDIDPVTEAGDFRVQMDNEAVDAIRATITKAADERIKKAMYDVWDRLLQVVAHIAERLSDEDNVFRKNTFENLEALVDMLPGLNIDEDGMLEKMRLDVRTHLYGLDPKILREDTSTRGIVAGEAKRIMETMQGYMNAFSQVSK